MSVDTISGIGANSKLFAPSTLAVNFNKPEIAYAIMKQYSDQFRSNIGFDLALLGNKMGISSDSYTVFKEGRYWRTISVAANTAASTAGGTQLITINVDTDNRFFAKKGQIIMYKGAGNIQGIITGVDVTTPTAPVLTIQAAAGVTLPSVIDTEEIAITTNAWGEGTGQPTPSVKLYDQATFNLQILKDTYAISGTQLTNSEEVNISEYGGAYNMYNVGLADLDARMYRVEENAYLTGSGDSYTVAAGTGLTDGEGLGLVQTMKGIIPQLRDFGGIDTSVNASNWLVTDLDEVDDYMKSQGDNSQVVLGYLGGALARRVSSQLGLLQGYRDATETISQYISGNEPGADAHARAVIAKFMEYRNINRCYAFKELPSLSDTTGLGATNYKLKEYGMWFPLCNVADARTNVKVPLVTVIYKEKDGYSRERELWTLQGAGGGQAAYNTQFDKKEVFMRSHVGLVFGAPNLGYITTAGE